MSYFKRQKDTSAPDISINNSKIESSSIGNTTTNNYYGGYTESGDIINGGTVYKDCQFDFGKFEKRLEEVDCVSAEESDVRNKALTFCRERNFEKLKALASEFLMSTAASTIGGSLAALFQIFFKC